MKTLLTILLVAFIVYYFFKYLGRFLLSKIFKNLESRMNDNNYTEKKEGEVTIQKGQDKNNRGKGVGEYVDFEEMQ